MNAYKPRDYQQRCLDSLRNVKAQGKKKALVVMASGLGKTLTSAFDVQEYFKTNPNGRVLVLCHSAAILTQTKTVFQSMFGDEYSYGMYNGDEKATHRTDFLFANLQSVNLHSEEFDPKEFGYVIVDEAHHSPAETYRKAIEHFRPDFLLGMTATPDRMDDADLSEVFGETVFEYDLVSAVNDGWLSDMDYRLELDELPTLKKFLDSGEPISLSQINREVFLPKRDEEIVRLIRERSAEKVDPTTVIFCQTIEHAEYFAKLMDAAVIHSKLDSETIAERLEQFRSGSIKTVCAVNMLNEGIDIPRTDVIVFLRVTQSRIVFFQQLGRGLRLAEGKGKVLVLDFVATANRLDQVFDLEHEFKSSTGSVKSPAVEQRETFTLNIDTPEFRERKVDIINLIERAKDLRHSHIHASDAEMLLLLRSLAEKLGRTPTWAEVNAEPGMPIVATYVNRFGSFANAISQAGLDAGDPRRMTDDQMLEALKDLAERLGHTPSGVEVNAEPGMPSSSTYAHRFGSFTDAIRRCGLEIKPVTKRFTDEQLLELLRECAERVGRIPTTYDLGAFPDMPSSATYYNRFGSLEKACEMAGLGRKRYDLPDEEMINLYRDFAEELGRRPTGKEIQDNPKLPSPGCYTNRFGGFDKVGDMLGIPKRAGARQYSDEQLLDALVQFKERVGRVPSWNDLRDDPSLPSRNSYLRRFKTYRNALRLAGFGPPVLELDNESLLELLREFGQEIGHTPSRREVDRNPNLPCSAYLAKRFGSFADAIRAAGFAEIARSGRKNKRSKKASE